MSVFSRTVPEVTLLLSRRCDFTRRPIPAVEWNRFRARRPSHRRARYPLSHVGHAHRRCGNLRSDLVDVSSLGLGSDRNLGRSRCPDVLASGSHCSIGFSAGNGCQFRNEPVDFERAVINFPFFDPVLFALATDPTQNRKIHRPAYRGTIELRTGCECIIINYVPNAVEISLTVGNVDQARS